MVYITGDTHGDLDRFKSKQSQKLKKGDTLLVCGDFGFIWDGSEAEEKNIHWLSKRKYNIFFIEGAHENYELLNSYPTVELCGGSAKKIAENIYLLKRGDIFDIEGKSWFAFGGGDDEEIDLMDVRSCEEFSHLPTNEEMDYARENLKKHDNKVDYIITYDVNFKIKAFLQLDQYNFNNLHAFLEEVATGTEFSKWFFGCYHLDRRIPPRYFCTYENIYDVKSIEEVGR